MSAEGGRRSSKQTELRYNSPEWLVAQQAFRARRGTQDDAVTVGLEVEAVDILAREYKRCSEDHIASAHVHFVEPAGLKRRIAMF